MSNGALIRKKIHLPRLQAIGIVVFFIIYEFSGGIQVTDAAETRTKAEIHTQEPREGEYFSRGCETQCDCYKNSGGLEMQTLNLCFECSRTRNNTCQVTASCASGHMCSIDTSSGSDSVTCIPIDSIKERCVVDSDCVTVQRDEFRPSDKLRIFNGHCLPIGKCRYLPYGVARLRLPIDPVAPYFTKVFDHQMCRNYKKTCRVTEDCFPIGKSDEILHNSRVVCDEVVGKCVIRNITAQEQEPIECKTDNDCYTHANKNDPSKEKSCYSCMSTFDETKVTYNESTPQRKQCIKTHSNCKSGVCLNGQCIGKKCNKHLDCFEIGGITRHCHSCDFQSGQCSAKYLCPYGSYCTFGFGEHHRCTSIVQPCQTNANNPDKIRADVSSDKYCVPTGTSGSGYYRMTDLFRSSGNVPVAAATAGTTTTKANSNFLTIDFISSVRDTILALGRSTKLTLAKTLSDVIDGFTDSTTEGGEVTNKAIDPLIKEKNIDNGFIETEEDSDGARTANKQVKIIQRTPTQIERKLQLEREAQQGSNKATTGDTNPLPGVKLPEDAPTTMDTKQQEDQGPIIIKGGSRNRQNEAEKKASQKTKKASVPSDSSSTYFNNMGTASLIMVIVICILLVFTLAMTLPTLLKNNGNKSKTR